MATWGDLKQNALKLGFLLTDKDVNDVPLLATDAYGNFIAGAHGFAQVVVKHSDGSQSLIEGTAAGLDLWHPDASDPGATVVRTGHAFIDDKAFTAAPLVDGAGNLLPDADNVAGTVIIPNAQGQLPVYDDELLNAHYVAGDGRCWLGGTEDRADFDETVTAGGRDRILAAISTLLPKLPPVRVIRHGMRVVRDSARVRVVGDVGGVSVGVRAAVVTRCALTGRNVRPGRSALSRWNYLRRQLLASQTLARSGSPMVGENSAVG